MSDHQRVLEYVGRIALTGLVSGLVLASLFPFYPLDVAIWLGVAIAPLLDTIRLSLLAFLRR